jgi:hypothetical protein
MNLIVVQKIKNQFCTTLNFIGVYERTPPPKPSPNQDK